jgi:hypothetical protein
MSRFSNADLIKKRYLVRNIQPIIASSVPIAPISARSPPPVQTIDASKYTSYLSSVGVSSIAYDVINGPDEPSVDLNLLYSNGYRYKYLEFKAAGPTCMQTFPATTITVYNYLPGGTTLQASEVTLQETVVITAYTGNAVVPALPNPNVDTTSRPVPIKLPLVPGNINC